MLLKKYLRILLEISLTAILILPLIKIIPRPFFILIESAALVISYLLILVLIILFIKQIKTNNSSTSVWKTNVIVLIIYLAFGSVFISKTAVISKHYDNCSRIILTDSVYPSYSNELYRTPIKTCGVLENLTHYPNENLKGMIFYIGIILTYAFPIGVGIYLLGRFSIWLKKHFKAQVK